MENVIRGLAAALVAVVGAVALTAVLRGVGWVGAIGAYVMAVGAIYLYQKGAGAPPRQGRIALVALIGVGLVAVMATVVITDLRGIYAANQAQVQGSEGAFILANLVNPEVLTMYTRSFLVMAAVVVIGTGLRLSRLAAWRRPVGVDQGGQPLPSPTPRDLFGGRSADAGSGSLLDRAAQRAKERQDAQDQEKAQARDDRRRRQDRGEI